MVLSNVRDSDYQAYSSYVSALQNLTAWFDEKEITDRAVMHGEAAEMVEQARAFVETSSHWAHAYVHQDVRIPGFDRFSVEDRFVALCREHVLAASHDLLELAFLLEHREWVSLQKRDDETIACPHADREAEWEAEVDDAFDDPAFLHEDLGDHDDSFDDPSFWR